MHALPKSAACVQRAAKRQGSPVVTSNLNPMCQGWEVVVSGWQFGQPRLVWTLDCISRPRNLLSNDPHV
jgi:hypothetical protein